MQVGQTLNNTKRKNWLNVFWFRDFRLPIQNGIVGHTPHKREILFDSPMQTLKKW